MIKEAKKTKSIKASVGYSIIIPGFYTAWGGKKKVDFLIYIQKISSSLKTAQKQGFSVLLTVWAG